jgi:protein TonB
MNKAGLYVFLSAIVHLGMLSVPASFHLAEPPRIDEIELVDFPSGQSTSFPFAKTQKATLPVPAANSQKHQNSHFRNSSESNLPNSFAKISNTNLNETSIPQSSSAIPAPVKPSVEQKTAQSSTSEPQSVDKPSTLPAPSNTQVPKPSGVQPAPRPAIGIPKPEPKAETIPSFTGSTAPKRSTGPTTVSSGNTSEAKATSDIPKPIYPPLARKKEIEGTVKLSVEVLPNGRTGQVKIIKSSGRRDLDQAAIRALKSYEKWEPAVQAGKKVSSWLSWEVQFKLVD